LLDGIQENGEIAPEALLEIDQLLKRQFRPEFLNRLDEIVCYKPLQKNEIVKIVDLMIANLQKRLDDKQLKLKVTDAAKDTIIEDSYDPNFGARPLKRYIQHHVETLIARKIIAGDISEGDTLIIDSDGSNLFLE
ncbi:MAG: type VI secretion system ATPase TssH, partial [Clostridiales bacterium]|nr:type VI secretion system ATPase TssH [Clostridiales bacterium]